MKVLRPNSAPRRASASATGFIVAGALALSAVVLNVDPTEASLRNTEAGKARIAASWPTAFASVVAGSVKSSNTATNNDGMTYQSTFRWTTQLEKPPIEPVSETTTPKPNLTRKWDQRYQGLGEPVGNEIENNLGPVDPYSDSLHNWRAVKEFKNPGTRVRPRNFRCLSISPSLGLEENCESANSLTAASNTTEAFGFSIASSNAFVTFLNAANLSTAVSCGLDSAYAAPPQGRVDIGTEQGGTNPYLSYGLFANHARTIWAADHDGNYTGHTNGFAPSDLANRQISGAWPIGAVLGIPADPWVRVMPVITRRASDVGDQPYAISEIAAYIEVFDSNLLRPDQLRVKMYFVLSRAECGVKRTIDAHLPDQRPVFPADLPGGNDRSPYGGGTWMPASEQSQQLTVRGLQKDGATMNSLPPTTTVVSPLENTTASETTTSAPPDPSDEDESTTAGTSTAGPITTTGRTTTLTSEVPTVSATPTGTTTPPATKTETPTSAAPAVVVPDEPGPLSATARLEDVGTVEVDGENLAVVVRGTTVPTDARTAPTALDSWINDGIQSTGNWKAFTSDDPAADGWRWAAINQETGTVVYVR